MSSHDDFDLRKITTPVLLYLLKGEVKHPRFFLLRCALTLRRFKSSVDRRFPGELVDLVALPLWVYINLKNQLGSEKAFEIMRVPILAAGLVKQNLLFQTVRRGRSFEAFVEQELEINQSGTTRWNTLEVKARTPERFELAVTRCMFHELTQSLGIPEATRLVCQVDDAVFGSYLPETLVFHRGGPNRRIADGCDRCHFIWEVPPPEGGGNP
jgi:hypothetical protein